MELNNQGFFKNVTFYKMGCKWGPPNPSFYEVVRKEHVAINHNEQPQFRKGSLILIAEGHTIKALGKALTDPIPITTKPKLITELEKFNVGGFDEVSYCELEFYELSSDQVFLYKLERGICEIGMPVIKKMATERWLTFQDSFVSEIIDNLSSLQIDLSEESPVLNFVPGRTSYKKSYKKNVVNKESEVSRRHGTITDCLYDYLLTLGFLDENISVEQTKLGRLTIDAIIKSQNGFIFFEVKTGNNLVSNVRQAIGQILEYAYLDPSISIQKLVIVGPGEPNRLELEYFERIKTVINVPLEYWAFNFKNNGFKSF